MKNQQSVTIKSGFQRGAQVWEIDERGGLFRVASVSDCTWNDDPVQEETLEVDEANHFIAYWRNDNHTRVWSFDWLGVDHTKPIPRGTYFTMYVSSDASEQCEVTNLGEKIEAILTNSHVSLQSILTKTSGILLACGSLAYELHYEWGCQPAAKWLIITPEGEMYEEKGCGDYTPWIGCNGRFTTDHEVADAMEMAESVLG